MLFRLNHIVARQHVHSIAEMVQRTMELEMAVLKVRIAQMIAILTYPERLRLRMEMKVRKTDLAIFKCLKNSHEMRLEHLKAAVSTSLC